MLVGIRLARSAHERGHRRAPIPRERLLAAATVAVAPRGTEAMLTPRAANGRRAYALATVVHERLHAEGLRSESQANCLAVQLVYEFARELNFPHARAFRLEQLAVRKTRAVAPSGYWNARRCRDGGSWDLYPSIRNLR